MLKIACIGEAMIELQQTGQDKHLMRRSVGGDTLNTAIYLRRLLSTDEAVISYVTMLGGDPYSDDMINDWKEEGLDVSMVGRLKDHTTGLYAIKTDKTGERSFSYWRSNSPARRLFQTSESDGFAKQLQEYDLIYFSGITAAILYAKGRETLLEIAAGSKAVAFDGNYRPALWSSGAETIDVLTRCYQVATYALPTFEDESALFAENSPEDTRDRLINLGCSEIVIKQGAAAVLSCYQGKTTWIEPSAVGAVVDTTGAGDSFNAGYLAARIGGVSPEQAVRNAHDLAGRVIGHHGAIMAQEFMPITGNSGE